MAERIDGLCQRYHCLPSQLLREDASLLYRLELIALGSRTDNEGDGPPPLTNDQQMLLGLADLSQALDG